MNAEDTAWARNWLRHAQGDWGKDDTGGEDRLRSQLTRVHQMRPVALGWLLANSDYARRLATQMHLKADADAEDAVREAWQDITAVGVRAKVRAIQELNGAAVLALGQCLAAALARYAPHHLGLLVPAWIKDYAEQTNVVPLRAAAQPIHSETRRGPVIEDEPP